MQEHIRRAHPDHYISKLPATEESFQLMINTPPSERPPPPANSNLTPHRHSTYDLCRSGKTLLIKSPGYGNDKGSHYGDDSSTPNTPRIMDDSHSASMPPAASAAAALAQLHNHKFETEWESENVGDISVRSRQIRGLLTRP